MADGCTATAPTETVIPLCSKPELLTRVSLRALKPPRNDSGTSKLTGEDHNSQHFLHMPMPKLQPQKRTVQASLTNDQGWKNKQDNQLNPQTAWCYSPRQHIKANKARQTYPATGMTRRDIRTQWNSWGYLKGLSPRLDMEHDPSASCFALGWSWQRLQPSTIYSKPACTEATQKPAYPSSHHQTLYNGGHQPPDEQERQAQQATAKTQEITASNPMHNMKGLCPKACSD
ncbi:Hypothetical predicted protein [Pelobates cultripes]|uniref:Uncharacterized protein n=1 Tax=Pelobates cultripes TaxID=61616 RepID=A0AAD1R2N2_PELCU|nr:Hypothetical predicted protein [Pelobates cultripes]